MEKALKPAESWKYVEGAVNCAFYQVPGTRIMQLSGEMAAVTRKLARGLSLAEAAADIQPLPKRQEILSALHKLPCLIGSEELGLVWPKEVGKRPAAGIEPTGAFLELTVRCNLRCVHCYAEAGTLESSAQEYSTAGWIGVMEKLRAEGFAGVVLTGGEPLARKDFVELFQRAVDLFPGQVTVLSNGALINEEICDLLVAHRPGLSLSFYSDDPLLADKMTGVKGTWQKVVRAIKLMLRKQVVFAINIVLLPENSDGLPTTRKFLTDLGVDPERIRANPVLPSGRGCAANTDIRLLQADFPHQPMQHFVSRGAEHLECPTCWRGQLTVTPTGEVLFCNMLRDLPAGELARQDLSQIIGSQHCQSTWAITLDDVETCRECELRFACYDCRAAARMLTGDLYARNPLCLYDPLQGTWRMATHVWERSDTDADYKPRAAKNLSAEKVGDEIIVRDLDQDNVFSLNPVAARIWSLCDGSRSMPDIARTLHDEYDADLDRLRQDVQTTVAYLKERGLLE